MGAHPNVFSLAETHELLSDVISKAKVQSLRNATLKLGKTLI
ncbi:hypothetical protein [Vibrio sp. EJY3]|nr:hypothetical protein [Vibrio sp. EJY3]